MTDIDRIIAGLSKWERFLLEWLSKEEHSSYGECQGRDLDALHSAMLVSIEGSARFLALGFGRVSLTPHGLAVRNRLKEQDND